MFPLQIKSKRDKRFKWNIIKYKYTIKNTKEKMYENVYKREHFGLLICLFVVNCGGVFGFSTIYSCVWWGVVYLPFTFLPEVTKGPT